MEALITQLMKVLGMSRGDAIVTAIFALAGFWIDKGLLPGGIPPGTMTFLFGSSGYLTSKAVGKIPRFQRFILRTIDRLVQEGHIPPDKGQEYKDELIEEWYGKS